MFPWCQGLTLSGAAIRSKRSGAHLQDRATNPDEPTIDAGAAFPRLAACDSKTDQAASATRFAPFFFATCGKSAIAFWTVARRLLRLTPSLACSDMPDMIVE